MSPYASPNDHRRYHYLELANRLRVLLICDPETDKSAASLAVNTGHFDDPVDRQGMAHFLEHMLFLGTRTYPKPGEYQQFMSRHGGSNNAWTGTEFTNFFFDIDNGFFEAGLDRFSQFFICHGDAKFLDRQYTAFGELVQGDDVLERIATVPTQGGGGGEKSTPIDRVEVKSIEIVAAV